MCSTAAMANNVALISLLLSCTVLIQYCTCARILCVMPIPSYSHSVFYWPVFKALAERGHELVILTPDPKDDAPANVKQIDWHFAYDLRHKTHDITNQLQESGNNINKIINAYEAMFRDIIDAEFSHPEVQKIIKNETEHFDLLFGEIFITPTYFFSVRFNCPYIIISSTDPPNFFHSTLGNPAHQLVYPEVQTAAKGVGFTFKERLIKSLVGIFMFFRELYYPMFASWRLVAEKYFGKDIPPIEEVMNNVSMVFVNSHPLYSSRPMGPGFLTIGGGTHLQPPKPLPEDIKSFLDSAAEGAIYFSLGTNVLHNHLTPELIGTFVEAFKDLPYKVLWKFETDIGNLTERIKIMRWGPQQDILRHKNIKLFITQCGMQSLEESLLNGIPMVGIPFVSDQSKNAHTITELGVALILNHKKLTKEIFKTAILKVLHDPSYKQNAVKAAELLQDNPMSGLEKAVWWTEYVLRHKGTPHLWNKSRNMPLWEYYFLDTTAFILAVVSLVLFIVYKLLRYLVKLLILFTSTREKHKVH